MKRFVATITVLTVTGLVFTISLLMGHVPKTSDGWFQQYRWVVIVHAVSASVFLLGAPVQAWLLYCSRPWHRRFGRVMAVAASISLIVALAVAPTFVAAGTVAMYVTCFGAALAAFTLGAAIIVAVVHGDYRAHGHWMIFTYCLFLSTSVERLALVLAIVITRWPAESLASLLVPIMTPALIVLCGQIAFSATAKNFVRKAVPA